MKRRTQDTTITITKLLSVVGVGNFVYFTDDESTEHMDVRDKFPEDVNPGDRYSIRLSCINDKTDSSIGDFKVLEKIG